MFKENISSLISEEQVKVSLSVLTKVEEKRKTLENKLELELMKFLHSKSLKDFNKLLN